VSQQDDTNEVIASMYLENVDSIESKNDELNEALCKATRRRFLSYNTDIEVRIFCWYIVNELDTSKSLFLY